MKRCWIVDEYIRPVHVFDRESSARTYAEMTGTEVKEAVLHDETQFDDLLRTMRFIHGPSDGTALGYAGGDGE